ncbi:uncharacterized protein SOCE836_082270 [Sorangium cellulosum]|uniref:Uncharacterized protein n=1 Tax=Sorangium cellulosum TaxID=56 RepID=A0A4P2R231_SORCE|nr:uncharacterized protein SOCE836_082270 [Sorangium cellulosum]WCQ95327.1 hypothetical protein NQZ70_08103 [Sorangium sp. Soce836]
MSALPSNRYVPGRLGPLAIGELGGDGGQPAAAH